MLSNKQLAKKFSLALYEAVGESALMSINATNKAEGYDKRYCASHSYVDANQVFLDAMEAAGYIIEKLTQRNINKCNAIWQLAKENDFYILEILLNKSLQHERH